MTVAPSDGSDQPALQSDQSRRCPHEASVNPDFFMEEISIAVLC